MVDSADWDWATGDKTIDTTQWYREYEWVEEIQASPDGETIAAIVNMGDETFNVCANGQTWESGFDKIWHLRFTADGRPFALVAEMDQWTIAIAGEAWPNAFDYAWQPQVTENGRHIAVTVQQGGRYSVAIDGEAWATDYPDIGNWTLSPSGAHAAAAVQVKPADSGQVHKFQEGIFSAAVDGNAWDANVCQCLAPGLQSR
jgi:hypothetical protein